MQSQSPQEYFRIILLTVVGQAFQAAGYNLEEHPVQWAGGQFRFVRPLPGGLYGFIEFQMLGYVETQWAASSPSRFRVTLTRTDQPAPSIPGTHPGFVRRTLSALVVEDFGVSVLPDADYWWPFANTEQLGRALAEAGHLIVGYGMPWLAGDLTPPSG